MKVKAYAIVEKDGDSLNILQTPRMGKYCLYTSRGRAKAQLNSTSYDYRAREYKRDYPEDAFIMELVGELDDELQSNAQEQEKAS